MRIAFELNGEQYAADVEDEPVTPLRDALIVEHEGKRYAIGIYLGARLGDRAYVAWPIREEND